VKETGEAKSGERGTMAAQVDNKKKKEGETAEDQERRVSFKGEEGNGKTDWRTIDGTKNC